LVVDGFNHALFLALNAPANPWGPTVLLAIVAAKYLIAVVPLHIALIAAGGTRAMRFLAVTAILALALALGANQVIGAVAYTPRPFLIGLGRTLIEHRSSASFPSNHATMVFTYVAVLALFRVWRLAATFACIGLLVAWSRIYLGVHFPLDMAGAAAVSTASAFVALQVMVRYGGLWLYALEGLAGRLVPSRRAF
jgi:undecaprenyl-diphosphatase